MIIDRAFGVFNSGDNRLRILSAFEVAHLMEGLDAETVRAAGIFGDTLTLRSLRRTKRRRHDRAQAGAMSDDRTAETSDPFAVTVVVDDRNTVELIPWSEDDQRAEAAFRAASRYDVDASLSGSDAWLARRSPFRPSERLLQALNAREEQRK